MPGFCSRRASDLFNSLTTDTFSSEKKKKKGKENILLGSNYYNTLRKAKYRSVSETIIVTSCQKYSDFGFTSKLTLFINHS